MSQRRLVEVGRLLKKMKIWRKTTTARVLAATSPSGPSQPDELLRSFRTSHTVTHGENKVMGLR